MLKKFYLKRNLPSYLFPPFQNSRFFRSLFSQPFSRESAAPLGLVHPLRGWIPRALDRCSCGPASREMRRSSWAPVSFLSGKINRYTGERVRGASPEAGRVGWRGAEKPVLWLSVEAVAVPRCAPWPPSRWPSGLWPPAEVSAAPWARGLLCAPGPAPNTGSLTLSKFAK